MSFHPLVTIVIPVYNGANYLRDAIDSALAQTYDNIEILVVNDGSNDSGETEQIALSYGEKVRYFWKENGRVASALNFGIAKMQGEYFSWLSHDDYYHPQKIESQIQILSGLDDRSKILFGGYTLVDANKNVLYRVNPYLIHTKRQLELPLYALLRGCIHGCSALIHKSHFERMEMLFREDLPTTQDYDFFFRLLRGQPIVFQEKLYVYSRSHESQDSKKYFDSHINECNELWIGFMEKLTPDEMMQISGGSVYLFYKSMHDFLESVSPYDKAIEYSIERAEAEYYSGSIESIKISVVIPFYNRVNDVMKAIASVQSQTHNNIEIILVDDGSDEDITCLKEAIASDSRICYLFQDNKGSAAARNYGISQSTGEYIAFLDSDDLFDATKLEVQLKYMLENGFYISHTSYISNSFDDQNIEVTDTSDLQGDIFEKIIIACAIATSTVMAKKDIFDDFKFPETFRVGEDVCLWIDIASRYHFGAVAQPLVQMHRGNESAARDRTKKLVGLHNVISYILKNPYYASFEEELSQLIYNFYSVSMQRRLEENGDTSDTRYILNLEAQHTLYTTLSWRITKPLRALIHMMRELRRGPFQAIKSFFIYLKTDEIPPDEAVRDTSSWKITAPLRAIGKFFTFKNKNHV